MLTDKTCRIMTGTTNSIWTGWTRYPIEDIWTRIVTWKLPLFQLAVQFPRVPLGFNVETATILHLLGDPVDSMTSLLCTLAISNCRARLAKATCKDVGITEEERKYEFTWKALALIMVSYDECGKSDQVQGFCRDYITSRNHPQFETEIRHIYEETANSLAADRATKSLPIFVAETFFIAGWLIALIKAASSEPSSSNWPNVEVHSIAFSGMYLWITSAVLLGSVIGASQTEGSIPRLLQAFEYDLAQVQGQLSRRPSATYREESQWCKMGQERAIHGGLNNWRPRKWSSRQRSLEINNWTMFSFVVVAVVVLAASYITAIVLSYSVPPHGLNCRHIPQTVILLVWLLSFLLECNFELWLQNGLFWTVYCKDLIAALINIGLVVITQWGIMNSCACWSMWGMRGLHLPQMSDVMPELMYYTQHVCPWITFMAILFQLIFCATVSWTYWDTVRVYIQRDDGMSNRGWQRKMSMNSTPK
ncbi:hypothetical protein BU23DRAFT_640840 [Bimuria novae-zelandiae CBS 107.79]|uniref:Uncharacterized protein n=1 Tax=Bimuria novae-zelandiae CBS 107.79 TaxID=1447943 RepID=A0A6A5VIJ3_9PLEO|nr:hypothetical protein BU23DRAFT_640840 [Bimuria novae-zelandiae CBS 107.79]